MELHQLRYLVSVVDEGSFTAAAAAARVSQSGVSAQVGKLERELGQRLLERGSREVRPTPAGEAVLPLARAALRAVDQLAEVAAELSGLMRGRARVGMVRGCAIPPFLDALAGFRREYPAVELVLAEDESDALQRAVLAGELDLALAGWATEPLAGLTGVAVVDEPLAVVVAEGHPLSRRTTVRLRDLAGETLLCLPVGTGVREAFDLARGGRGGIPGPVGQATLEASSPVALVELARRGAGVAVLSESMAAGETGVVTRVLSDTAVTAKLGLVVREGHQPPATRALMQRITEAMT